MFFRVMFGPILFAALVVALGATAACGSDDAATATSTSSAAEPTATATSTARLTPTPIPTSTPTPIPSPTATATLVPEQSPVTVTELGCTQLYPGVFNPDGPVSSVSLSAKVTNTGESDVPVKVSSLGGAIIFAQFFNSEGDSLGLADTTLTGVVVLEPGQTHDISISNDLFTSQNVAACEFGINGPDSFPVQLSGAYTDDVEVIYAP